MGCMLIRILFHTVVNSYSRNNWIIHCIESYSSHLKILSDFYKGITIQGLALNTTHYEIISYLSVNPIYGSWNFVWIYLFKNNELKVQWYLEI